MLVGLTRMCCACARVETACMPVDGVVFFTAQTSWMRAELWGEGPALVGVNRVPFRNSFARFCCDCRPSALPLSRAALDQCVGAQLKGAHFSHCGAYGASGAGQDCAHSMRRAERVRM